MFDSLEERIKQDEPETNSTKALILRNSIIVVVSVALFAGLYEAMRFLG
jgi:hypothetical protein